MSPPNDPAASSPRPPSVDALARSMASSGLPQPVLVSIAREAIAAGDPSAAGPAAASVARRLLQPVVNATGVLLHTNLGRAPLAHHQEASYTNLEFDLVEGERGSRRTHAATLLARAVGAEAGLVVNNGAAAVLLVLAALGAPDGVVVSRGELVEIGGGFRVPDVMTQSGARLVEVGTTNRTRIDDYERAIASPGVAVALTLKVHQSNYRIVGFTESVNIRQLAALDVPLVVDVGSGLLDASCPWLDGPPPLWLADEPAVRQVLGDGAAVVTFSGDKLLGGPQAGVIVGQAALVERCAAHPLARALRPGGLVLAALQETASAYLRRDGSSIAFWRMATITTEELRRRADTIAREAGSLVEVTDVASVPGGGTLPGVEIPSIGVRLSGDHAGALRAASPPIVARVAHGATICDLRTVDPLADTHVANTLRSCAASAPPP